MADKLQFGVDWAQSGAITEFDDTYRTLKNSTQ